MIKEISFSEREQLEILATRIKENKAVPEEYDEYLGILNKAGFSDRDVLRKLVDYGYGSKNWEKLINDRTEAKSYDQKKILEVILIASLVAFALSITFFLVNRVLDREVN
jgi:hypothetical protein